MLSIIIPITQDRYTKAFINELERQVPLAEIVLVHDKDRRGKGWAIREGFKECTGEHIAFIDGDGDIPPRMLKRLLPFIEDYDIVCSSKHINTSLTSRKIISFFARMYIRIMFNISVDTQTGLKIFRREVLKKWDEDSFLFDIEILARAKRMGANMIEVPILVDIREKVSQKVLIKMFLRSIKLWWRLLWEGQKNKRNI